MVEDEIVLEDTAQPTESGVAEAVEAGEVALEEEEVGARVFIEGGDSGGTIVEYLAPNVGLDAAGIKALLGYTLANQLDHPTEEEDWKKYPISLAYDRHTQAFRNLIYLRFKDKKYALQAAELLSKAVCYTENKKTL